MLRSFGNHESNQAGLAERANNRCNSHPSPAPTAFHANAMSVIRQHAGSKISDRFRLTTSKQFSISRGHREPCKTLRFTGFHNGLCKVIGEYQSITELAKDFGQDCTDVVIFGVPAPKRDDDFSKISTEPALACGKS